MDKKQVMAIGLILVAGVVLGLVILKSNSQAPSNLEESSEVSSRDPMTQEIPLTEEQISAAHIKVVTVQPATIAKSLVLPGEIGLDENRTAHVLPLASGVVESVVVDLGQAVKKGQTLAVIASQEISDQRAEVLSAQRRVELERSNFERERILWEEKISAKQDYLQARQAFQEAEITLQNARQKLNAFGEVAGKGGNKYELRAPFDGVIIAKRLVLGENVNGLSTGAESSSLSTETSSAFTVSDLSKVWANFNISPKDLKWVQVGKPLKVISPDLDMEVEGKVTHIGNLLGAQTRTAVARVTLDNPQQIWRPGLFVSVQLLTEAQEAAISVPVTALQQVTEQTVVFVRTAQGFLARPVALGNRDASFVEIRSGLSAGEQVASTGSFVLKSSLLSSAED